MHAVARQFDAPAYRSDLPELCHVPAATWQPMSPARGGGRRTL